MLKRKEKFKVYLQKMFETLGWENGDKSKLFQSGEQRMHRPQYNFYMPPFVVCHGQSHRSHICFYKGL